MSDLLKFDQSLLDYLKASAGAGSIVTLPDEATKKQLTATKSAERPIIELIYKNIPKGKKEDLGEKCMFSFRLFPSGQIIKLPMMYRPDDADGKKRDELRIYMNTGVFRPNVGLYWFVFVQNSELWIGALDQSEISAIKNGFSLESFDGIQSISEDDFQDLANLVEPPKLVSITSLAFQRDPAVARKALLNSGFKCEMLPETKTFISRSTGKPYLEAHHLVPMFWQRHINTRSIDVLDNICVLSPFAHKMVHHGRYDDIRDHIGSLADKRREFLKTIEMDIDQVLDIYKSLSS